MDILNIQLPMLYAMQATAVATKEYIGSNDKNLVDQIAVKSFRDYLQKEFEVGVRIAIGEGEKDKAPMLYNGEELGHGNVLYDIAIDPVEGTSLAAIGKENALTVLSIAKSKTIRFLQEFYSKRIVVSGDLKGVVSLKTTIQENIKAISKHRKKSFNKVTIALLNRNRHKEDIENIIAMGAKVKLIDHGDLAYGILALLNKGVDMLYGIGGTPESIILASAVIATGGYMELMPVLNYKELILDNKNPQIYYGSLLQAKQLISDPNPCFMATALTNSCLGLNGVETNNKVSKVEHLILHNGCNTKISVVSDK